MGREVRCNSPVALKPTKAWDLDVNDVIKMVPHTDVSVNSEVVEVLRRALRRAEAGKLAGAAIAEVFEDGNALTTWAGPPSMLVGVSSIMTVRLATEI